MLCYELKLRRGMNICLMTLFGKERLPRLIELGFILIIVLEIIVFVSIYFKLGFLEAFFCFVAWETFEANIFYIYRKRYKASLKRLTERFENKSIH